MKKGMYPIARKLATQSNPLIVGICFYSHLLLQNLSPYSCWEFGLRNKQQNWDDVGEKRSHMLMDRTWSFFGRLFLLGLKKLKCVITQKAHKSECNSRSYKIVTVHCANAYIMSMVVWLSSLWIWHVFHIKTIFCWLSKHCFVMDSTARSHHDVTSHLTAYRSWIAFPTPRGSQTPKDLWILILLQIGEW